MNRIMQMIVLCSLPLVAGAADDFKVSQLELELRNLQREVNALSREVAQMRSQLARPDNVPPLAPQRTPPPGGDLWLDRSKWQQLRTGMSELEVIRLLGPPSSMRTANQERVLLYAMEIGSSGFLGGSVTLRDRAVVSVKVPELQ